MLVFELLQNDQHHVGHTKKQANGVFMQIETNLDNLQLELNQLTDIKNNLDANIDHFLNNTIIINCFYLEQNHFKACWNVYKTTDVITDNRQQFEITHQHVEVIKEINKTLRLIIRKIEKHANPDQTKRINQVKQYLAK